MMKTRTILFVLLVVLALPVLGACNTTAATSQPEAQEPAAPSATPTQAPATATEIPPTATEPPPTATQPPPTDTPLPPTETPVPPDPIVINEDQLAADGCPLVELNPETWSPLYAAYNTGSDPFYHIHTNEDDFFFNLELYTVFGPSWSGQLGTFEPDCNGNGICIYLVPDAVNPYWATAGEITITALSQEDGVLVRPVEISMADLTLMPVPGSTSQGCYHVEQITVTIEAEGG